MTILPGKLLLDKVVEIFLFAWNLKGKGAGGRSPGAPVSPESSGGLEDLEGTDLSGKKHKIFRTENSCLRNERSQVI